MKYKAYILILISLFAFTSIKNQGGNNEFRDTQSTLKALYIYNFATLTDWPSSHKKNDFIIAILSTNNRVYDAISKKYSGKSIGRQKIKIVKHSTHTTINNPNILYVDKTSSSSLKSVNAKLKGKSTMLVTNRPGSLGLGATINFVEKNNKQAYEINVRNAKSKKLVIASRLIDLAIKKIE
ncbi:MAG: YfiR family protein [Crocinitomicaceae bacterium]